MTLHIINRSPKESSALEECLAVIQAEDALLFIENGVYAATSELSAALQSKGLDIEQQVWALLPDVEARGIQEAVAPAIGLIDYHRFVEITTQHQPINSWLF